VFAFAGLQKLTMVFPKPFPDFFHFPRLFLDHFAILGHLQFSRSPSGFERLTELTVERSVVAVNTTGSSGEVGVCSDVYRHIDMRTHIQRSY